MICIQCIKCKHYHQDSILPECDAFPNGIPREILVGEHTHTKPYENDHEIRFEQKE